MDSYFLKAALEHKYRRIEEACKKGEEVYFWEDIESGIPFECSKAYYEQRMKLFAACKPTLKGVKTGSVIFCGTGGSSDHFEKLFYNERHNERSKD